MNKKELGAKWAKYCNTDKLVDDAINLLRENKHNASEHGVCTLLDIYFTQKEPLIKLFMTSKNYIGGMRIAVVKEFERQVDSNDVYYFFQGVNTRFHLKELLKFMDSEEKTIWHYLCVGKNVVSIADLPSKEEQKEKIQNVKKFDLHNFATIESNRAYCDFYRYVRFFSSEPYSTLRRNFSISTANTPELKMGTKTSRAFNKVCVHYGIDKLAPETKTVNGKEKTVYPYDKAFAEYSDLVSNLTRKMHFVISLNPLDYLTMSSGVNWISCHNIKSGGAMGGTLSYMLDTTSMITFVVTELEGDIHRIPKVYRQMYHYENNLFIQNRLYPQGNDGATNLYDKFRGFMIEEFSELLGADDWKHVIGRDACKSHIISVGVHYPDYNYNKGISIFYPRNNEPSVRNHVMTIGHEGICVNCGKQYSRGSMLAHYDRADCL